MALLNQGYVNATEGFLSLVLVLPLLLSILNFQSFWVAVSAFLPPIAASVLSLFFPLFSQQDLYFFNILYALPALLMLLFFQLPIRSVGRHVFTFITYYSLAVFTIVWWSCSLYGVDLYSKSMQIVLEAANFLKANKLVTGINSNLSHVAFFVPCFLFGVYLFIWLFNYSISYFLSAKHLAAQRSGQRYRLTADLPNYYIYLFCVGMIGILIGRHMQLFNANQLFLLYNVAVIAFLPFSAAGIGVMHYFLKSRVYVVLIIFLASLTLSFWLVALVVCLLGFLKEGNLFRYINFYKR